MNLKFIPKTFEVRLEEVLIFLVAIDCNYLFELNFLQK